MFFNIFIVQFKNVKKPNSSNFKFFLLYSGMGEKIIVMLFFVAFHHYAIIPVEYTTRETGGKRCRCLLGGSTECATKSPYDFI